MTTEKKQVYGRAYLDEDQQAAQDARIAGEGRAVYGPGYGPEVGAQPQVMGPGYGDGPAAPVAESRFQEPDAPGAVPDAPPAPGAPLERMTVAQLERAMTKARVLAVPASFDNALAAEIGLPGNPVAPRLSALPLLRDAARYLGRTEMADTLQELIDGPKDPAETTALSPAVVAPPADQITPPSESGAPIIEFPV